MLRSWRALAGSGISGRAAGVYLRKKHNAAWDFNNVDRSRKVAFGTHEMNGMEPNTQLGHPLGMDSIVKEAREFAVERHGTQRRKYSEEPYVKHLDNVTEILGSHGLDHPTLRAAAYLHDTVEKTATTYEDLLQRFGPEVTELVFWMTDLDIKNKEAALLLSSWRLARAPREAKLIKLADLVDNIPNVRQHDPQNAREYCREKSLILARMAEVEDSALTNLTLYKQATDLASQ
jgi:(p)ppGpp synthase/HD superfamily hydrolase